MEFGFSIPNAGPLATPEVSMSRASLYDSDRILFAWWTKAFLSGVPAA